MSEIKKRTTNKKESLNKESVRVKSAPDTSKNDAPPLIRRDKVSLRVLSRIVIIGAFLVIAYYTSNSDRTKPLAKQSEVLSGKGQIMECSPEYRNELNKYDGCLPQDCGRFVTDQVVSLPEAEHLLSIAKKGLALGGSSGGASILDLHSGALSMDDKFINIYKTDKAQNLFTEEDFTKFKIVKDKIKYAISHHFGVNPAKIYLTHPTFFSRITSQKAVTTHDEYWHQHVDKETYKSFHYTTLLYLNDFEIDFKGGRFIFIDGKVKRSVEPRKGRVSMFTSGAENVHHVEKVTSGTRYAVTISFTCDKAYAIADPSLNNMSN